MMMRSFIKIVFASMVFMMCSLQVQAAEEAAGAHEKVVLFIDADRIMGEALVAKDIRAQVDRRKTELQGVFARRGEKLQKSEEELLKQRGILSSEAFETKVLEFRQSVDTMNRDAEAKMTELEVIYGNALGQVYEKIQQISKSFASDSGAQIVFFTSRAQVSYVAEHADVTDKVLEVLNKDLSRVSLGD
ncbi:MAG: OmpH family outer membrane protein [Aaplasma endosymbiont of Hyalomma asiaticum]